MIYPKPTVRFQDEDDQKDDDDNDDDDHDDDKDPVLFLHIQAPSEDLPPKQHNQSQKKKESQLKLTRKKFYQLNYHAKQSMP